MKVLLLISAFFLVKKTVAQTNGTTVVLHQDSRLDSLYKALKPKTDTVSKSQRLVYRLVVDSILSRRYAYQLKAKFINAYQQKPQVYISYSHPFFKVKLGDFLSKDSAVYFKKAFFKKFKLNTTVAPDIQNLMWRM